MLWLQTFSQIVPSACHPLPLSLGLANSSAEMPLFVPSGSLRLSYISSTAFLQSRCSRLPRSSFQLGRCQIPISLPPWSCVNQPRARTVSVPLLCNVSIASTRHNDPLITCPTNTDWTELNQVEKRRHPGQGPRFAKTRQLEGFLSVPEIGSSRCSRIKEKSSE